MTQPHLTLLLIQAEGSISLAQVPSAPPIAGTNSQGAAPATTGESGTPVGPGGSPQQQAPASPFGGQFIFLLLALMLFMIMMSVFSGRKEKRRRSDMLSTLSRHDRVLMAGGMIGTIVELKDDEVVLKVDESNNTRIHFSKTAVQSVLKSSGSRSDEQLAEAT
jgi:preprotein translocase subunit YajC